MSYIGQEVKRKKGETFESMLRRFSRRLQQSGRLIQARKVKYHQKQKSKTQVKRSALRRLEIKKKREYLQKIGKLKEERPGRNRTYK